MTTTTRDAAGPRPSSDKSSRAERYDALQSRILGFSLWARWWFRIPMLIVAFVLFVVVVTTPLGLLYQTLFAVCTFVVAIILNRLTESRLVSLILIMLSIIASMRYMYWRVTTTLGFETWVDTFFGYGLLAAELYAFTVLLLSYFQSSWPLKRQSVLLPADSSTWPSVDIYIPTYNEPLSVVRQTILTALSQDWPANLLNIYVLDDGRRPEFRTFCEEVGVGYLTRSDNKHAKAGNINAALKQTSGEYVAIFDCDHIPTRSFLQVTMGWFLKDPNLAMLQTPHVFFSPDPIEHNLDLFHKMPNEGQLFYGLVQDGNDLWNATFFCGSCAILRREHLEAVGGIATESVTEDALTALKMNRLGYNTAYLAVPQAAGLATENLSRHVGQRIRWARGMAQIMRKHNPLLGKGLNLAQRLCYGSAALHFFYGLPRLVFLTAPLAYLFFGAHVFQASALMVAAYALPHILHAQATNSRVQGQYRHSFWNEVYESVLAWYLMLPTLAVLVRPDSASFNVTVKGAQLTDSYFDWRLARPYIVLLILNICGFIAGLVILARANWHDSSIFFTALINLAWTFYNIVICSASVAVAGEQRQFRSSPRITTTMPAAIGLPSGHRIACETFDFSQDGVGLSLPGELDLKVGDEVIVSLFRGGDEGAFPAIATFVNKERAGLRFNNLSLSQQIRLARLTFARADIWATEWTQTVPDAPWTAITQISRVGARGFRMLLSESAKAVRQGLSRRSARSGEAL